MSVEDELKKIFCNTKAISIDGVIAVGGVLSPELLVFAYEHGVFPWPHEGYPLLWFRPEERGVLDFSDLHLSRSFKKWHKKNSDVLEITKNRDFAGVIEKCREAKRPGQKGTWITDNIEKNYRLLHLSGHAISIEVWRDKVLVGGLYGVQSSRYFSCESMFFAEENCSKLAFFETVRYLQSQGFCWMDLQMVTPVCANFGGKLISKNDFLNRIGL